MLTNKYSFLIGLEKSIFRTVVAVGPLLIGVLPEVWMNITLGTAIMLLINYAKNKDIKEVEDTSSEG